MTEVIVLDLGEYGEISVAPTPASRVIHEGLVQAGIVEDTTTYIKVKIQEVLRAPLTGVGIALCQTLPSPQVLETEYYELDEISLQFQVGLATETGLDLGAVVKIVPNGGFNCTYRWKQKKRTRESSQI